MFRFKIQTARHSDVKAVARLCREELSSELSPDKMNTIFTEFLVDAEQIVLVAFTSGHVAGFIHARQVSDLVLGRYVEIVGIAMLEYYKRSRGGTSLILGVEKWCSQMQHHKTVCFLKSESEAMRSLLIHCGYRENGFGAFEKYIA